MKKPSFEIFKEYLLNTFIPGVKPGSIHREYIESMLEEAEEVVRDCYNRSHPDSNFENDFLECIRKKSHAIKPKYLKLNLNNFFLNTSALSNFVYDYNLDAEKGSFILEDKVITKSEATELDLLFPYYNKNGIKNKVINRGDTSKYSSNLPIYIGQLRSILDELEKEGATRVTIEYHSDHYGYYFTGSKIIKAYDEEE